MTIWGSGSHGAPVIAMRKRDHSTAKNWTPLKGNMNLARQKEQSNEPVGRSEGRNQERQTVPGTATARWSRHGGAGPYRRQDRDLAYGGCRIGRGGAARVQPSQASVIHCV